MSNVDHIFLGVALVGVCLALKILRECIDEWDTLVAARADLVVRKARGEQEIDEVSKRSEILASELADLKLQLKDQEVQESGVSNRIADMKKKLEKLGVKQK